MKRLSLMVVYTAMCVCANMAWASTGNQAIEMPASKAPSTSVGRTDFSISNMNKAEQRLIQQDQVPADRGSLEATKDRDMAPDAPQQSLCQQATCFDRQEGGANCGGNANFSSQCKNLNAQTGNFFDKIDSQCGLPSGTAMKIGEIESGCRPNVDTQAHKGLFQYSSRSCPGANLMSMQDQASCLCRDMQRYTAKFSKIAGKGPSPIVLYMMHQQGECGGLQIGLCSGNTLAADAISSGCKVSSAQAWRNVQNNIPSNYKAQGYSANNITCSQLKEIYANKMQGISGAASLCGGGAAAGAFGGDGSAMTADGSPLSPDIMQALAQALANGAFDNSADTSSVADDTVITLYSVTKTASNVKIVKLKVTDNNSDSGPQMYSYEVPSGSNLWNCDGSISASTDTSKSGCTMLVANDGVSNVAMSVTEVAYVKSTDNTDNSKAVSIKVGTKESTESVARGYDLWNCAGTVTNHPSSDSSAMTGKYCTMIITNEN